MRGVMLSIGGVWFPFLYILLVGGGLVFVQGRADFAPRGGDTFAHIRLPPLARAFQQLGGPDKRAVTSFCGAAELRQTCRRLNLYKDTY